MPSEWMCTKTICTRFTRNMMLRGYGSSHVVGFSVYASSRKLDTTLQGRWRKAYLFDHFDHFLQQYIIGVLFCKIFTFAQKEVQKGVPGNPSIIRKTQFMRVYTEKTVDRFSKNCRGGYDPVQLACTLRRNRLFPTRTYGTRTVRTLVL